MNLGRDTCLKPPLATDLDEEQKFLNTIILHNNLHKISMTPEVAHLTKQNKVTNLSTIGVTQTCYMNFRVPR